MKHKRTTKGPSHAAPAHGASPLGNIPNPNAAYDPAKSMGTAARINARRAEDQAEALRKAHNQRRKKQRGKSAARIVGALAVVCALGAGGYAAWQNVPQLQELLGAGPNLPFSSKPSLTVADADLTEVIEATPIIARSKGVDLHCAVPVEKLSEILIHNASNEYALPITTKLKEADNMKVMKKHGTGRDRKNQPTGDKWMTGKFIRCWRAGYAGPTMSAIDCGAKAGTQVLSPVSGEVVLVKKYDLYGIEDYPDVRVHIQPDANPDADVVLIHLADPTVKRGDRVEAGITPIAKVRNVYKYLGTQMQLRDYTAKGDNGNHTHICVNDKNHKDYHGLDDLLPKKEREKKQKEAEKTAAKKS